jgi:hypothetical protein
MSRLILSTLFDARKNLTIGGLHSELQTIMRVLVMLALKLHIIYLQTILSKWRLNQSNDHGVPPENRNSTTI